MQSNDELWQSRAWAAALVTLSDREAEVVIPVPRLRVRVLVGEQDSTILERAVAKLLRLRIGLSGLIANELRIPEEMVLSALDSLARDGVARWDEATSCWMPTEVPHQERNLQSARGWVIWDPLEDELCATVFRSEPPAFHPDARTERSKSSVTIEVSQPPLPVGRAVEMVALGNQSIDEFLLFDAASSDSTIVAIQLGEDDAFVRSGFAHLAADVSFLENADGSFEWVLYQPAFHSRRFASTGDDSPARLASTSCIMRIRESYPAVAGFLDQHARELAETRRRERGVALPAVSQAQYRESMSRLRKTAAASGLDRVSLEREGFRASAIDSLCGRAADGTEFGGPRWYEWIRELGPFVEQWFATRISETERRAFARRLKRGDCVPLDHGKLRTSFGAFVTGVDDLCRSHWANEGRGPAKARKAGFRDTVNQILYASLFRIDEARPYRELVDRLLGRCPQAFHQDWLSLLIDLRNQAAHNSGWISRDADQRDLDRLRRRLEALPGGLGTSTEIVTERAFAIVAASMRLNGDER